MKINKKGKTINFLLTCNHVIDEEKINKEEIIEIYYGKINQETKKIIKLDKNDRYIKTFKIPIDITLI